MQSLIDTRVFWYGLGLSEASERLFITEHEKKDFAFLYLLGFTECKLLSPLEIRTAKMLYGFALNAMNQNSSKTSSLTSSSNASNYVKENFPLALFLLNMMTSLHKGSTCIPKRDYTSLAHDELTHVISFLSLKLEKENSNIQLSDLVRLLNEHRENISNQHSLFIEAISKASYSAFIASNPESKMPIVYDDKQEAFYFQKHLTSEIAIAQHLQNLLSAPDFSYDNKVVSQSIHKVLKENPFPLNAEQEAALALAVQKKLTLIIGGPGTGKTSIVVNLIKLLQSLDHLSFGQIKLAAPTGRAAVRLQESVSNINMDDDGELASQTLHKLLGYNSTQHQFKFNKQNPIPAKLIVIDEVSMVDLFLFSKLLEAIPQNCRLILMGDKNQLSSVGTGAVLGDVTGDIHSIDNHPLKNNTIILIQSHRSEKAIWNLSQNVLSGKASEAMAELSGFENKQNEENFSTDTLLHNMSPGPCRFYKKPDIQHPRISMDKMLQSWADKHYLAGQYKLRLDEFSRLNLPYGLHNTSNEIVDELFIFLNQSKILNMVKSGFQGTVYNNQYLQSLLQKHLDPKAKPNLFSGLPLMLTVNDSGKNLYNGDTGLVVKTQDGYGVLFPRTSKTSSTFELIPYRSLPDSVPAFAITVHKSQGSEYNNVLLVLPDYDVQILNRKIIYTGLTRAKKSVAIYGDVELFHKGVLRNEERRSGIVARIK